MWPNPQFTADLVTFNGETLNGKLHFLCSETSGTKWVITPVYSYEVCRVLFWYYLLKMIILENTLGFAKKVTTFHHKLFMASLDAESLFINVPCNKTINNCVEDLFDNNAYHDRLSEDDLYRIIKLPTSEAHFIFDNELYKQTDGATMESPLEFIFIYPFSSTFEQN